MMTHDPDQRWSMQQVRDDLVRISRGERFTGDRRHRPAGTRAGPGADRHDPRRAAGSPAACGTTAPSALGLDRSRCGGGRRGGRGGVRPGRSRHARGRTRRLDGVVADERARRADRTPARPSRRPRRSVSRWTPSSRPTSTRSPRDPEAAFEQLTPAFQAASGDYEGYIGWWSKVRSAELKSVESNPADQTVAYTVTYQMKSGAQSTQRIRLQLQRDGDDYLIANEV